MSPLQFQKRLRLQEARRLMLTESLDAAEAGFPQRGIIERRAERPRNHRWKMLRWCERVGVNYIIGLAKNQRLQTLSANCGSAPNASIKEALARCVCSQASSTKPTAGTRSAGSLPRPNTAIGAPIQGTCTNLAGRSQALYDELYCARGEMENRIKEQQLLVSLMI
jgi:hypothetical protein